MGLDLEERIAMSVIDYETISAVAANFIVSFLKFTKANGIEDAIPAGSGTLVTYRSIYGILTAGHVLEHLPNKGEIGLVRFSNGGRQIYQNQRINMEHTDRFAIYNSSNNSQGPDLGFLRLPSNEVANLKATNVFYNLEKNMPTLDLKKSNSSYVDAVVGVIAERTNDLPYDVPAKRIKNIHAQFGVCNIIKTNEVRDFDLIDCRVTYDFKIKDTN